jgi:hypothetical protein
MPSLSMQTHQTVSVLTHTQPNTRGLGLDDFQAEIKGKAAPDSSHRYGHTSADSARRDLGQATPLRVGSTFQGRELAVPPSPTSTTESSAYYTSVSSGGQIEATFQNYHQPVLGRQNMYPYHGSLSGINEENPWRKMQQKDDAPVLLRSVEPQSVDDA